MSTACSRAIKRCAVVFAVALGCLWWAPSANAAGGGAGASGNGDEIITSILAATGRNPGGGAGGSGAGGSAGSGSTSAPRCTTHVLNDRQIVFLLHVAANMPELLDASFLDAIEQYSNTSVIASVPSPTSSTTVPPPSTSIPPAPTRSTTTTTTQPVVTEATVTYWDLTVRICDGIADTMSVQPRSAVGADVATATLAGNLFRRTTRLPAPLLAVSPPPRLGPTGVEIATIVGEPVFFSTLTVAPVSHTAVFAGRTVDVEATPQHLELFSGQPGFADRVEVCKGLGVPFDPDDDRSVMAQASAPEACTLLFERATGGGFRSSWTGYAALEWTGRYRVDGGAWTPLDGLFSTSVFDVAVGEVETLIGRR